MSTRRFCFSFHLLVLAAIVAFQGPIAAQTTAPVDPGFLFLEAFASSCHSRGLFSQRVSRETNALKQIVETLKDDPACQGLQPLFRSLVDVSDQIDFYRDGSPGDQRGQLQAYADRLSVAIQQTADPALQSQLGSELLQTLVDEIHLSKASAHYRHQGNYRGMTRLTNYLETIEKQYVNQMACFDRHKTLPIQLAGHLLSVSGAFFDPAMNLALSLAGRLVSTFASFFADLKFARRIRDYQATTLQTGLVCAMEALEQTICDIQDRRSIIDVLQSYRRQEVPSEWLGYELLTQDFNVLTDFLIRVASGAPAGSVEQASKKAEYRQNEGAFNSAVEMSQGMLASFKQDLLAIKVDSQKQNALRSLVSDLAQMTAPISSFRKIAPDGPDSIQLWLRINDPKPIDRNGNGETKSYSMIIGELNAGSSKFQDKDAVTNIDINQIESSLKDLIGAASDQLAVDRSLSIGSDPQTTLASWSALNRQRLSPENVSLRIQRYLELLTDRWRLPSTPFSTPAARRDHIDLADSTIPRFKKLIADMTTGPLFPAQRNPETDAQAYATLSQSVYDTMQLNEREQWISNRFAQIVDLDLMKRLDEGFLRGSENLEVVVRISKARLTEALMPGTNDRLSESLEDLDNAEPDAKANLRNFFKHYQEAIIHSINYLKELAADYRESEFGVTNRRIAKLCVLAMNDPLLPENKDLIYLCTGRVLGADSKGVVLRDPRGQELAVRFSAAAINKSPEERMCSYRRLRNQIELYEDVLTHSRNSSSNPVGVHRFAADARAPKASYSFEDFSTP